MNGSDPNYEITKNGNPTGEMESVVTKAARGTHIPQDGNLYTYDSSDYSWHGKRSIVT